MTWAGVATLVIGAVTGGMKARTQRQLAKANQQVENANAEGAAKIRLASNAAAASTDALNRWSREVNNARLVTDIGESLGAQTQNFLRASDVSGVAMTAAIREAEQAGAQAAAAALAGVGGSVVDRINQASDLSRAIREEAVNRNMQSQLGDMQDSLGQTAAGMLRLDTRTSTAQLDYGISQPRAIPYQSVLEGAVMGALGSGGLQQAVGSLGRKSGTLVPEPKGVAIRGRNTSAVGGGDLADFAFDRGITLGDQAASRIRLGGS